MSDPDGDCATCPKDGKPGDTHSEIDGSGTTPTGGFVFAGKGSTLNYTNIGSEGNANWVISSFKNKDGAYTWNNDKKWYVDSKGILRY